MLLRRLLRQVGIKISPQTAAERAARRVDEDSLAEPIWVQSDDPANKKDAMRLLFESLSEHFHKNSLLSLAAERKYDGGRDAPLDPRITLHQLVPLLHENSYAFVSTGFLLSFIMCRQSVFSAVDVETASRRS